MRDSRGAPPARASAKEKRIVAQRSYVIAVLEGDGIGPEVTREAVQGLRVVEGMSGVRFDLRPGPLGGRAWFEHGASFPEETKKVCDAADAILKGPIGLSFEESKK